MTPAQLKSWRLASNLTQAEAAALLGIQVRWLRYAENGTDGRGKPRDTIPPAIELEVIKCDRFLETQPTENNHVPDKELP